MSDTMEPIEFPCFPVDYFNHPDFCQCPECKIERELSNMTDQRDAAMQALEWAKKNHERELADAKQETFKVTHQIRNWLDEIPSSWGELGEIPISVMVGHALQEENKTMRKYLNESEENQERISVLERELAEARDQLDRLADAMKNMWPFIEENDYPGCNTPEFDAAIEKYKSALAAMKGGQS